MPNTYIKSKYIDGLSRGARFRTTNYMGSLLGTTLHIDNQLINTVDTFFGVCPIKLSTAVKNISLWVTDTNSQAATVTCYLSIDPKIECQNLTATTAIPAMTTNLLAGTFVLKQVNSAGDGSFQELKFQAESYGYVTLFERIKNMLADLKTNNRLTDAQESQIIDLWKLNEGKPVYICFAITGHAISAQEHATFEMISVYGSPSEMHLTAPMIEPVPGSNF